MNMAVYSPMSDEDRTEAALKGKTAPRLTPADIDAAIVDTKFHRLPDSQITVCVLTLVNGTKLLGYNYGSVSAENHDWGIGAVEAKKMAREKVWELEGYLLRQKMYE
jgi:hypothetical protein